MKLVEQLPCHCKKVHIETASVTSCLLGHHLLIPTATPAERTVDAVVFVVRITLVVVDNRPVSMDALSRLFVQAHAARQVLERHGLTAEWVAACEALAVEPAPSKSQNDQFGEETYADDGILKEMLSHANPARN